MNKRRVGEDKEQLAQDFLKDMGYVILQKNYRCRIGEIDLIAKDGKYLVFVEVKYRSTEKFGNPLEAVDYNKQLKIRQVANCYLMYNRIENAWIRFDVVGILADKIQLIKDAF